MRANFVDMCDALVAAPGETASGRALFAKNSDRPEHECQPLLQLPASQHAPGTRVRCTHLSIPQVAETYGVIGHSPWWVWGFEQGVNEHAVAIGNLTVFSKEPVEEKPGLIGMDLVRLGLERGRTAREALEVMAGLLEAHGQGGSAFAPGAAGYHNGFAIADAEETWLLQTSNRRWAARRARTDSLSNQFSLTDDWEIGSRDLEAYARAEGWWQAGQGRLDVTRAYRNPHVPGRISEGRLARSHALLERAGGELNATTLEGILRDHLEGGPVRLSGTTPDDEAYYTLCMHSEPVGTTTASLVAELPLDRSAPWPVWVSFGTPCTGIFLPVYLDGVIPAAFASGGESPDPASAWWSFKALQDAAATDFPRHTPRIREAWKELEAQVARECVVVERGAAETREAGDPDGAADLLSAFMTRVGSEAMTRARELAGGIESGSI